ncbi:MAG TPA: hypothetical protein VG204_21995 [Terriglobia bacterium]|nr:hypothetical protein [Terriglobia bacterium]
MIDPSANVREHYGAAGFTGRTQSAVAAIAPEGQTRQSLSSRSWISFISGAYSPPPN